MQGCPEIKQKKVHVKKEVSMNPNFYLAIYKTSCLSILKGNFSLCLWYVYALSKTCQAARVDFRICLTPVKPSIMKQMIAKLIIFTAYKADGCERVFSNTRKPER